MKGQSIVDLRDTAADDQFWDVDPNYYHSCGLSQKIGQIKNHCNFDRLAVF